MQEVYILYHSYELSNESKIIDEVKALGVYSTEENAKKAIEFYSKLPGFSDYPIECFEYDKYEVGKCVGWRDGFFDPDEYYDEEFYNSDENED